MVSATQQEAEGLFEPLPPNSLAALCVLHIIDFPSPNESELSGLPLITTKYCKIYSQVCDLRI